VLRVWHAYRGQEQVAFEAAITDYAEAHPELRFDVLENPADAYYGKLESASPRGNGPDVFIGAHERVGSWAKSGLVEPISATRLELESVLHPKTLDALTYDGMLYGYPLTSKSLALFRNKRMVPEAPQSTDEMLRVAAEYSQPEDNRFGLAWQATEAYHHAPWMHAFGGGVQAQDGSFALHTPENIASIDWVAELLATEQIPNNADGAMITQLFNEERVAMIVNGPWFLGEIEGSITETYAVSPLPILDQTGRPAAPYLTVEGVFVSAYSMQTDEASELAAWLITHEVAIERARVGRQVVATLETLQSEVITADPVLSAFAAQLEDTVPMSNQPEMTLTWEPMAEALRSTFRSDGSSDAPLERAQRQFEATAHVDIEHANPLPYLIGFGALFLTILGGLTWQVRKQWSEIRQSAYSYVWIAPAALSMLVLVVLPFTVGAFVSLFTHHDQQFHFVGMANFIDIVFAQDHPVTDPKSIYFTLAVTLLWTVSNVFLHVAIGLGLAMILREPWLRLRAVYRVLLILPWAVPNYITAMIWKGLFHENFGAINGFLVALGAEPVSWFESFATSFCAVLVTNTWLGFPFMMVVTLGALQAIPRDLEHAAEIDGATGWQRFWYVTLPMIKPALLPAVILGSVWTFNMFNIIYLVSDGEPGGSTEILISEAYKWAFERNFRYGYAAAYAVLVFGVLLIYSKGANKLAGQKVL
jgi:arabinogalactan oligomer/maltooligosaccharide transport system permease protein